MAGFYIHIPFCRKVCYYCDFHFVATLKYKDEMLVALLQEIKLRSRQWKDIKFETLYFGGGTPSVLTVDELNRLTNQIIKYYNFSQNIEFTLETNPDDLTPKYLNELRKRTEVNRLSIGTQSFHDKDLTLMNRRHTGEEAFQSILNAQQIGFENLNIDLIYGTPGLNDKKWDENISSFLNLQAPHLSAYHMSIEPKTVFEHMRKKNKLEPVNENQSQTQYKILIDRLEQKKYQHYEISNLALEGYFSKHNTNYWLGKPYIGIGPSAHSYIDNKRKWNVANNTKYCKELAEGSQAYFTEEELSISERYNDYMLTSLRTMWGVNFELVRNTFGEKYIVHIEKALKKFINTKHIVRTNDGFAISENGWMISDFIMRDLFYLE